MTEIEKANAEHDLWAEAAEASYQAETRDPILPKGSYLSKKTRT